MNETPGHLRPEYGNWRNMLSRCRNPKVPEYPNYGGRGIRVCDRWRRFKPFIEDMGPRPSDRHSVGRIDNDGDYEPSNCRWETPKQQNRNTRQNRMLTYNGETHCVVEWAENRNLTTGIIQSRLLLGWSVEKTLSTPARWKLKPEQVAEIRSRLATSMTGQLAREFGVCRGTIRLIRLGKIWR